MIDLFASVGVERFDITFTNLDGEKRGFRRAWPAEEVRRSMLSTLIQSCVAGQQNIIVRPHAARAVSLIQLDDLDSTALERVSAAAFLTFATSLANHQAWVAVKGWSDFSDFGRRLKQAVGADLSASGATRLAGSVNFKGKYAPDFPSVVIVGGQPGRSVTATEFDGMGLVAAAEVPSRCISRETRGGGSQVARLCV